MIDLLSRTRTANVVVAYNNIAITIQTNILKLRN